MRKSDVEKTSQETTLSREEESRIPGSGMRDLLGGDLYTQCFRFIA